MKIALCLSGQPRNITRSIPNILEKMDFEFDVFCHSWWDKNSINSKFKKEDSVVSSHTDNNWVSQLYENLNIKKILIEEQVNFNVADVVEQRKFKYSIPFNNYSSLYSVYRSNELKSNFEIEKNFKYDWVIRSRYDFGLAKKITIENLDNNKVYVPDDNSHNYGFNDQFAIGSSKNIDVYSETFFHIEELTKSHNPGIYVTSYCERPDNMAQEQWVQKQLESNDISFELKNFQNFLFRQDGNTTYIAHTRTKYTN